MQGLVEASRQSMGEMCVQCGLFINRNTKCLHSQHKSHLHSNWALEEVARSAVNCLQAEGALLIPGHEATKGFK